MFVAYKTNIYEGPESEEHTVAALDARRAAAKGKNFISPV
jgi:hypothetical protein